MRLVQHNISLYTAEAQATIKLARFATANQVPISQKCGMPGCDCIDCFGGSAHNDDYVHSPIFTLNTLDDAILPLTNWAFEFLDTKDDSEEATDIKTENIASFQDRVAKPLITMLKNNLLSRFVSQDIVSSFSIFDLKKVPGAHFSGFYL